MDRSGNEADAGEKAGEEEEEKEEEDIKRFKEEAVNIAMKAISVLNEANEVSNVGFLARGGYNYVWLVTYTLVRTINRDHELITDPTLEDIHRYARSDRSSREEIGAPCVTKGVSVKAVSTLARSCVLANFGRQSARHPCAEGLCLA